MGARLRRQMPFCPAMMVALCPSHVSRGTSYLPEALSDTPSERSKAS